MPTATLPPPPSRGVVSHGCGLTAEEVAAILAVAILPDRTITTTGVRDVIADLHGARIGAIGRSRALDPGRFTEAVCPRLAAIIIRDLADARSIRPDGRRGVWSLAEPAADGA